MDDTTTTIWTELTNERNSRRIGEPKYKTLSYLLMCIITGRIRIDQEIQRPNTRWTKKDKSKCVDSIIRGFGLPSFTQMNDPENDFYPPGHHLNIIWLADGFQRISALLGFWKGGEHEYPDYLPEQYYPKKVDWYWEEKDTTTDWDHLPVAQQRAFLNTKVNIEVKKFENKVDISEYFCRINTRGKKMRDGDVLHSLCTTPLRLEIDNFRILEDFENRDEIFRNFKKINDEYADLIQKHFIISKWRHGLSHLDRVEWSYDKSGLKRGPKININYLVNYTKSLKQEDIESRRDKVIKFIDLAQNIKNSSIAESDIAEGDYNKVFKGGWEKIYLPYLVDTIENPDDGFTQENINFFTEMIRHMVDIAAAGANREYQLAGKVLLNGVFYIHHLND